MDTDQEVLHISGHRNLGVEGMEHFLSPRVLSSVWGVAGQPQPLLAVTTLLRETLLPLKEFPWQPHPASKEQHSKLQPEGWKIKINSD